MTIDPTRKEWQAARKQVISELLFPKNESVEPFADALTTAALGCPCPPEPPPEPFRKGECTLVRVSEGLGTAEGTLWVGIPGNALTPVEAVKMAEALVECAIYIRGQEPTQTLVTDNPSFDVGTSGWKRDHA
jgi:hypothetical protein